MDDAAAAPATERDPSTREPMRTVLPGDQDTRANYFLLNSLVVPRPIAWVSSRALDGTANLAPHSYFTVAASEPPTISFTSIGDKDTVRNVRDTGSFVVHVVDHALVERMNVTAANAPAHVSEFGLAGLGALPADHVDAAVVAAAPVAIECELDRIVDVGNSWMVLGRVVAFHVAERLFDEQDRVAPDRLDAVARMGGSTYATTRDRFDLRRPTYEDVVGRAEESGA